MATADAYLTLAAAEDTIRAAQAGVDRAGVLLRTITAQVNAQLRPGADASRADAELAAARTQLIQAQQAADVARATLAQFVGARTGPDCPGCRGPASIAPGTGRRGARSGDESDRTGAECRGRADPGATACTGALLLSRASICRARRIARGTGAEIDGRILGGLNGLAPNVQNYALGFSVTFPVSDLPSIRAREAAQSATIRAQQARAEQIATDLRAQWNRAVAMLNGARRIAANTPVQVSAARAATQQATARYEAGLGNHRRSGRSAAPAHAGRDRRRAGPARRLARTARRGRGRRRYPALRCRGERGRSIMRLVLAALSRPITVVVALIAIALCAVLALQRMPVDIFPQVGDPAIYVAQPYGGMDPAQMEGYLTYYYEYHFLYITGIDHVESKSIQGAALMKLVFHEGTDMSQAMAETVGYVNRARAFMPPGTVPPFITRFDAGSVAVGPAGLQQRQPHTQGEMQDFALNRVRPLFATLPGVSAPPPFGGNQRTIVITLDPDKLQQYQHLARGSDRRRQQGDAGHAFRQYVDRQARTASPAPTPRSAAILPELLSTPIRPASGTTVYLRDIGTIENGTDIVTAYAHVNGKRTVYIPVTKRADASTLAVINAREGGDSRFQEGRARRCRRAPGIRPVAVRHQFHPRPGDRRICSARALTGLMVLIFLRDWRSALIVVLNIPFALLSAVILLWATGQTINIMTLGGLALAVGVLVDEATVEIENIHTQMLPGVSRARAVRRGLQPHRHGAPALDVLHSGRLRSVVLHGRRGPAALRSALARRRRSR